MDLQEMGRKTVSRQKKKKKKSILGIGKAKQATPKRLCLGDGAWKGKPADSNGPFENNRDPRDPS